VVLTWAVWPRTAESGHATERDLRTLRAILAEHGVLGDLEVHVTEWSSSSSSRDHTHDFVQAATYVFRANLATIGLADSLAYWTAAAAAVGSAEPARVEFPTELVIRGSTAPPPG
jgi:beta-xylosidase